MDSLIPHIYHDTVYSKKLFEINNSSAERVIKLWEDIGKLTNPDNLVGAPLDLFGENYKVYRDGDNDDEYRKRIKFEVLTLQFQGSISDYKEILAFYYDLAPEEFYTSEGVATIKVGIPPGLDRVEVFRNLHRLKAAGVKLIIEFNTYISDFTFEELESFTFEELELMKLERSE